MTCCEGVGMIFSVAEIESETLVIENRAHRALFFAMMGTFKSPPPFIVELPAS